MPAASNVPWALAMSRPRPLSAPAYSPTTAPISANPNAACSDAKIHEVALGTTIEVSTWIVVPSATSWIFASLHAAFGFALIGAVVGEYAGADKGLGLLIANAQGTFDAAGIYAGMIITTVIALLAEWSLTAAENRLLRWRPPAASAEVQI